MVDVKFVSRVTHFVPYPLLRKIAANGAPPAGLEYIGEKEVSTIKGIVIYYNALERDRLNSVP
jgi:hypothetical protein